MPAPLTILVVHNHYQQRGGEDSVFETECAMLEAAGHVVIRYEKHNDEIGAGEKGLAASGQRLARQDGRNDSPATSLAPSPCSLAPSPSQSCQSCNPVNEPLRPLRSLRENHLTPSSPSTPRNLSSHAPTHSKPGSGAEPQHQLLSTHYSLLTKFQLFVRTIWNSSTYREITALIREHHPDIVHCHNTFPLISPSVYWAAAKQGVPVVQTLHNYRLICINPYLYRGGGICEDCLGRSPLRGVIHRCYRNSFSASFTVAAMLMVHRLLGTYRNKVTTYIALTEFGRKKFLEARLCDPSKVVVKPNAVAAEAASAEGLAASGQRLGAEDAQGSGFRVQDQRLAASGQRLGSEGAQGSGFRVKSEEQRLAAPTAQVLGTRYQVLANTASTEDEIATKSHEKPQKAPSSHTEALAASATAEAVPQVLGTRYQVLANTKATPKDNPEALAPSTYPLIPEHCCGRPATVLYVGRLSPEKGVDILIAAWKQFLAQQNDKRLAHTDSAPKENPPALVPSTYYLEPKDQPRLLIIGDGPERNALEAVAANIHSIHFLGAMPKNQVVKHMGQASLLVFPSVWQETFGLTILEAASLGTTAIVSDIGGQASLVEDGVTGYLFHSGSAESLAETLAKALADPDQLAHISATARERFHAGDCPSRHNLSVLVDVYSQVTRR